MKTAFIVKKLIKAIICLIILLYFMMNTKNMKIVFVPFVICATMSVVKNIGLLIDNTKMAFFFDRVFKIVFFLSWFAFLIIVCIFAIKENNYKMIFFTLPFWIGGLFFVKRKLL